MTTTKKTQKEKEHKKEENPNHVGFVLISFNCGKRQYLG
jgi:hypothetical protein